MMDFCLHAECPVAQLSKLTTVYRPTRCVSVLVSCLQLPAYVRAPAHASARASVCLDLCESIFPLAGGGAA